MTFQEAQAQFLAITDNITLATPDDVLMQKQDDLVALQESLLGKLEFTTIVTAIAEISPKLTGGIIAGTLIGLKEREKDIKEAADMLTRVSEKANRDARNLTFEKPKLVVAALTETVSKLEEMRADVKNKNYQNMASNVEALITLFQQVKSSVKAP